MKKKTNITVEAHKCTFLSCCLPYRRRTISSRSAAERTLRERIFHVLPVHRYTWRWFVLRSHSLDHARNGRNDSTRRKERWQRWSGFNISVHFCLTQTLKTLANCWGGKYRYLIWHFGVAISSTGGTEVVILSEVCISCCVWREKCANIWVSGMVSCRTYWKVGELWR